MLAANVDGSVIVLCLVIAGLLVAGFFIASLAKRRYMARTDDVPAAGFTLSDLRRLHESGQMSDAEFDRAKSAMIVATQRAEERRKTQQTAAKANPLDAIIEAERRRKENP